MDAVSDVLPGVLFSKAEIRGPELAGRRTTPASGWGTLADMPARLPCCRLRDYHDVLQVQKDAKICCANTVRGNSRVELMVMAEEPTVGRKRPASLPICAVFSLEEVVSTEQRLAVVGRVLNEFSRLPVGVRNNLRSAVNDEVIPTTGGFRKGQAGRGPGKVQLPAPGAGHPGDSILRCPRRGRASVLGGISAVAEGGG